MYANTYCVGMLIKHMYEYAGKGHVRNENKFAHKMYAFLCRVCLGSYDFENPMYMLVDAKVYHINISSW